MILGACKLSVGEGRDDCRPPEVLPALRPGDDRYDPHLTIPTVPYQDGKDENEDG